MSLKLFFLAALFSLPAHSKVADIQIPLSGKITGAKNFITSPDGTFSLVETYQNKDSIASLEYVDFARQSVHSLVKAPFSTDIIALISTDSQKIIAITADHFGFYVKSINVLTLNALGEITQLDSVYNSDRDQTKISRFNIELSKYGDLIYISERSEQTSKITAYNLSTKLSRTVFEYAALSLRQALTHGPNSSGAYALKNENIYFSGAVCAECDTNAYYSISTRDLSVHLLNLELATEAGNVTSLMPDETTSSPWVVVDRCGDPGFSRLAFNVDTSEEALIFLDKKIRCSSSSGDFVKINGSRIALYAGAGIDKIFDLNSRAVVLEGQFNAFSSNGNLALMGRAGIVASHMLTDFSSGETKSAFTAPSEIKSPVLMQPQLDDNFFILADMPIGGPYAIPIWKIWGNSSRSPLQIGTITGRDFRSGTNCATNPARNSVVCQSEESVSTGSLVHIWEIYEGL